MQFTETADNCTLHTAGTVRYNASQRALEFCDGSAWLPLAIARIGDVAGKPGRHCLDILNSGKSHKGNKQMKCNVRNKFFHVFFCNQNFLSVQDTVMVTDSIGLIQMVDQHMTRSKLFATCKLRVGVGL